MKYLLAFVTLILGNSSSSLAGQAWKFELSDKTPATITINGDLKKCEGLDPENDQILISSESIATIADACSDVSTAEPTITGLYQHGEWKSSLYIYQGSTMNAVIKQIYSQGGLANGINGKCPSDAKALLSIRGEQLGDQSSIHGYCLFQP